MNTNINVDDVFLSILNDWVNLTTSVAENAVSVILKSSSEYLSDEQRKALSDFHSLYFAQGELTADKSAINREVDTLFDAIQANLASGKAHSTLDSLQENEEARRARLTLSGVQKKLETIIQLESGLKEKLGPTLTSMQFEDALKQRLTRMVGAWRISLENPPLNSSTSNDMAEKIAKSLGSRVEREAFYTLLLNRDAPKDMVEDVAIFDSLI